MVARIIRGKDIIGLLNYNEKEKSSILYAQLINDIKAPADITLKDKIQAFQAYINLNPKISKPTFHLSLNPDPSDKLNDNQLIEIGRQYMDRMNYGQQPFIIYKHEDIDRIHIHIVSVNIGLNGKAIPTSNERYRSEAVRKELEIEFGLVKASEKVKNSQNIFEPINVQGIEYGKTDTKSAISAVVRSATRDFKFTSLPEFKTLLNQYNVTVDEVKDKSDPDKTLGLLYSVINREGEKVSTRIKASSIDKKVGLTALLDKFSQDEKQIKDANLKSILSQKINGILKAYPYITQVDFKGRLKEQGIQVVYRQSQEKRLYGITFIDNGSKMVINGRSLGKEYSAHTFNQRFSEATLSGRDLQKANKALIGIYHEYRKTDDAYYFESSIIKALPELAGKLVLQLQKQAPDMGKEQASLAVTDFIQYRQKQLPKVQEKETSYFSANTPQLVDFIRSNTALSLKQKLSFLYANNIAFSQKGDDLLIYSTKSQEVGYAMPQNSIFNLFGTPATEEKLAVTARKIPLFKKADRDILKVLSHKPADRNYKDLKLADRINFLDRSPILPYLSRTDKHLLYSHANLSYVDGFFRTQNKDLNYHQTLSNMLGNGLLVKPVTGSQGEIISYNIGYYKFPESTFVKAGAKLTNYLQANNFNLKTEASIKKLVFRQLENGAVKVSPKYSLIVRLKQAYQKNDLKVTHNVLSLIHKINKPLALKIEKDIAEIIKLNHKNGDAEKVPAKDLIPVIQKEIAGYPADTLREQSLNTQFASRYSPESKQGAGILESLGTLFNNLADAVFGIENGEMEEHKPEKDKRKKRRRPRW